MKITYILNFSHPMHAQMIAALSPCVQLKLPLHLEPSKSTYPQVVSAVNQAFGMLKQKGVKFDGSNSLIFVPPSLPEAAVIMLAELHGRLGYFPKTLSIRHADDEWTLFGGNNTKEGVVDLNMIRNQARVRRY